MESLYRKSRVQLIAATKTQPKSLITTELFTFYASLPGFVLDNISAVYQFKRGKPFAAFIQRLVQMRQRADQNSALAPLGVIAKLVGNSAYALWDPFPCRRNDILRYGRTLLNPANFINLKYLREDQVESSGILSDPWLRSAAPLAQSSFWEISLRYLSYTLVPQFNASNCRKKRVLAASCPVIGLSVLCNSKKALLSFAYFMLDIFNCESRLLKIVSMDTDSCECPSALAPVSNGHFQAISPPQRPIWS
jgi:hypothetical protein